MADYEEMLRIEQEIEALRIEYTGIRFQRFCVRKDMRNAESKLLEQRIANVELKVEQDAHANTVDKIKETDKCLKKVYMKLLGSEITPKITKTIDQLLRYKQNDLDEKEKVHESRMAELKAIQMRNPTMRECNELNKNVAKLEKDLIDIDHKINAKTREWENTEKIMQEMSDSYEKEIQQLEANLKIKENEILEARNHENLEVPREQSVIVQAEVTAEPMISDKKNDSDDETLEKFEVDETLATHYNFDDSFVENADDTLLATNSNSESSESVDPLVVYLRQGFGLRQNVVKPGSSRRTNDRNSELGSSVNDQDNRSGILSGQANANDANTDDTTSNFVAPSPPVYKRKEHPFSIDKVPAKKPHYDETYRANEQMSPQRKSHHMDRRVQESGRHVRFDINSEDNLSLLMPPTSTDSDRLQTDKDRKTSAQKLGSVGQRVHVNDVVSINSEYGRDVNKSTGTGGHSYQHIGSGDIESPSQRYSMLFKIARPKPIAQVQSPSIRSGEGSSKSPGTSRDNKNQSGSGRATQYDGDHSMTYQPNVGGSARPKSDAVFKTPAPKPISQAQSPSIRPSERASKSLDTSRDNNNQSGSGRATHYDDDHSLPYQSNVGGSARPKSDAVFKTPAAKIISQVQSPSIRPGECSSKSTDTSRDNKNQSGSCHATHYDYDHSLLYKPNFDDSARPKSDAVFKTPAAKTISQAPSAEIRPGEGASNNTSDNEKSGSNGRPIKQGERRNSIDFESDDDDNSSFFDHSFAFLSSKQSDDSGRSDEANQSGISDALDEEMNFDEFSYHDDEPSGSKQSKSGRTSVQDFKIDFDENEDYAGFE
ncbi:uncharacterized protein LOC116351790 [Contarinia nasturtii]|uniref:uncharacterized protein LOC116351790 n=1 Tax=Contarinia nasturtii TaxID=265458 RepID=UPI0012D491F1|nr:uncharacterized protein LOC116351790 [Contarinia nasturtii]